MTKGETLTIRIDAATKAEWNKIAREEGRTVSGLLHYLVTQHLRNRGALRVPTPIALAPTVRTAPLQESGTFYFDDVPHHVKAGESITIPSQCKRILFRADPR